MMKIGLIKAGNLDHVQREIAKISQSQLVGIVDIQQHETTLASESKGIAIYPSIDKLMMNEAPDVIVLCLPSFLHKEYIGKAAQYGCSVFCENPIAASKEDAEGIIAVCQQAGISLMVSQPLRYAPDYRQAKQLIDQGSVGKVGTVRMIREGKRPAYIEEWYPKDRCTGEELIHLIMEGIDWLDWAFGKVERVYAKRSVGRNELPLDHVYVSLRMKNGVIAHLSGSWAHPEGWWSALDIAGRSGVISMEWDESLMPIRSFIRTEEGVKRKMESPVEKSPYYLQLQHFIHSIQDKKLVNNGKQALQSLEISLAALQSLQTGRAISL